MKIRFLIARLKDFGFTITNKDKDDFMTFGPGDCALVIVLLDHLIVVPPVEKDPHHQESWVLVRPKSDKMGHLKIARNITMLINKQHLPQRTTHSPIKGTWGPLAGTSSQG